ncbi:uncharacterized protein P884DRAFT_25383 [Thermothelomyces heterothallicus CBS 202.75]|uniref:uncharacterized protein n=1 Tax=Thermothelomyces heterothallicus CBS 202.75 TaxID=1149848 RepID=UPI0037447ACB
MSSLSFLCLAHAFRIFIAWLFSGIRVVSGSVYRRHGLVSARSSSCLYLPCLVSMSDSGYGKGNRKTGMIGEGFLACIYILGRHQPPTHSPPPSPSSRAR